MNIIARFFQKKAISKTRLIVTNLIVTLVFALLYYYFRLPALNLKDPAFYVFIGLLLLVFCVLCIVRRFGPQSFLTRQGLFAAGKDCCAVPAIILGVLIVVCLIGALISSPIFRARAYSQLLTTEQSDFVQDIDEISFDQIPMLDSTSANNLANRKLGELYDLVSQFEVNPSSYQINYQNRPVRVTYLNYGDLFKWLKNTRNGLPAYMVVDMVTQEVTVKRLAQGMRYAPSEYFFRYTNRYLRIHYPTLMFEDINFEIDENGDPWWVASVITKRIGLFGGKDICGAVLLNAVTGESKYYDAKDIPTWVDRAFTADLLVQQYNYYGLYHNGFINSLFTQSGCTNTTRGYNYIAQGDDVWVYTGITSLGGDNSNIGFILVNERTKEAKYYAIPGAEEYSAMSSAQGAVQQYSYNATFPLLLNIESQPTYFMALKDASNLVKMYAMVNVQQYQIVATGTSVAECKDSYHQQLLKNNLVDANASAAPSTVPDLVSVTGTIQDIRSAVVDGNTHYYLLLDDGSWYDISIVDSEVAAILDTGDDVTLDTSGAEEEIIQAFSLERAS